MSVRIGKETRICNRIMEMKRGQTLTFALEKSKIGRLRIGGTSDCPRFHISDNRNAENYDDELFIVEAVYDNNGSFYFKPIFSDDKLLIYSEDYMFGDYLAAPLGEIKTSNNRQHQSLRNPYSRLYSALDPNYVVENRDLVVENPLAIELIDLIELHKIDSDSVISYNQTFARELSRDLATMKLNARNALTNDYEMLYQEKGKTLSIGHK